MDDGYLVIPVRRPPGTTIDSAIVALSQAPDGTVVAGGPSPQYRYEHYDPRQRQ